VDEGGDHVEKLLEADLVRLAGGRAGEHSLDEEVVLLHAERLGELCSCQRGVEDGAGDVVQVGALRVDVVHRVEVEDLEEEKKYTEWE
jgi:hypothetical protein